MQIQQSPIVVQIIPAEWYSFYTFIVWFPNLSGWLQEGESRNNNMRIVVRLVKVALCFDIHFLSFSHIYLLMYV